MGLVILYSVIGMLSVLGLYIVVNEAVSVFRPSVPHTSAVVIRSREDAENLDIILFELRNVFNTKKNEHIIVITERRFLQIIRDTGLIESYRAELIIAEDTSGQDE